MHILKLEPFSGLSGDMFLGLLADLADAHNELQRLPKLLHLENELSIEFQEMNKNGIACKHVKIKDLQKKHRHEHDQHHHHHHHRHLKDVNAIIDKSDLDDATKSRAKSMFLEIGKAESEVHGVSIDTIHFHEVGAIDSIADVVGAAWLIEKLEIEKTYCTTVCTGSGFVKTEHGLLPVPAPATQKILQGIPVEAGETKSELVTPTGAAILKNLNPVFEIPPLVGKKIGYGPGEKEFTTPNVLRGELCQPAALNSKQLYIIECNIDDSAGEALGAEMQQLVLEAGAVDLFLIPALMKKGRQGTIVQAMVHAPKLDEVLDIILEMTSTIGVRYYPVSRKGLKRSLVEIETKWGNVWIKEVILPSGKKSVKPESDDVMRIARENKLNVEYVKNQIICAYLNQIERQK